METRLKILHIEDNPRDAMLMQALIASNSPHYDLVHVDNLREALSSIKSQGYNAVMLDLSLRDSTAKDSVRAIRTQNPELPIIVVGGLNDNERALEALEEGAQECVVKGHSDGTVINMALQASLRRKAAENRLRTKSNYDELTGLPNGNLFAEHLHHAINHTQRWERKLSVMFIDLYGMEHVARKHGQIACNKALMELSCRINTTLRNTDIIARYSDDQFVVLLDDHSKYMERSSKAICSKLQKSLDEPYSYKDKLLDISANISVAILEDGQWHYRPASATRFIPASAGVHPLLDSVASLLH